MIYDLPACQDLVDQGDVIDGCPVLRISQFNVPDLLLEVADCLEIEGAFSRIVVFWRIARPQWLRWRSCEMPNNSSGKDS